jgi:hypothetical protein
LANLTTGIANSIKNNKLKNQERLNVLKQIGSRYYENMDSQGLNNIPVYTKYGGYVKNKQTEGLLNDYIYGDVSLYQTGGQNPRYEAGARLSYYKNEILNPLLRNKNPEAYDKYFEKRKEILKSGDQAALAKFDEESNFNDYLSPSEVKNALGNNYKDYLNAVREAGKYIDNQSYKNLVGNLESDQDLTNLNYGRRFASLPNLVSYNDPQTSENVMYEYNPKEGVKVKKEKIPVVRFQTGGSPNPDIKTKYKNNPYIKGGRDSWSKALEKEFPISGGTVKEGVYQASSKVGVNPALLFTSSMEEGLQVGLARPDEVSEAYNMWAEKNKKLAEEYPIDAFYGYGLDRFSEQYKGLIKKGYLPEDFNNRFTAYDALNEKKEKIKTAAFKSDQDALMAKAAIMRDARDQVEAYAKQKGVTLSDKSKDFFTLAAYNAGAGNMQKMIQSYDEKGYLKTDDYLKPDFKPASYAGVYENIQKRLQNAEILSTEGFFSDYPAQSTLANPQPAAQPKSTPSTPAPQRQMGGQGIREINGLPEGFENMVDVEAEEGEIVEKQNGNFYKIADDAGTHEEGGVKVANVKRVLEDTSDKRKDKASKSLLISPEEFEKLFGFKSKKSVSHSKAFEMANEHYDKQRKKIQDAQKLINEKGDLDHYASNSAKLNFKTLAQTPSSEDVFDALFLHQEFVKETNGIQDDGSMKKCGGKYMKAQAGINVYPGGKTEKGRTTPSGVPNTFAYPGGLESLTKAWQEAGFDLSGVQSVEDFQAKTYDYLMQTPEGKEVLRAMWETGNTDKGIRENILTSVYPTGKFSGQQLTDEELGKLKTAYVDGMLGIRTITPSVLQNPGSNPVQNNKNSRPLDTSVKGDIEFKSQPKNDFYEPTYWNDLAPSVLSLMDSLVRTPEFYNSMEFNQLRYKLLDPTEALNANQADFNAVIDQIDVSSGSGASTAANLLAKKYAANNQVIANFENQNAAIKNQEITYNTQVRDRQSMADAQTRGKYYRDVQIARENQRQQRLKAIEDISRVVAMKRRQNASGDLVLKLSPAFDQFGEYNDYQQLMTLPSVNAVNKEVQQPAEGKKPTQDVYMKLNNGKTIRFGYKSSRLQD